MGQIGGERIGKAKLRLAAGDGIRERRDIAGFDGPGGEKQVAEFRFDEAADATADHGLSVFSKTISKSDPGGEIGLLRVPKALR